MKIKSVEAIPLAIPFTSGGGGFKGADWSRLFMVLVRLESQDGIVGWGDAFGYSCWAGVKAAIDTMFAPLIKDVEIDDIPATMRDLQVQLHTYGRYGISMFAISGIDIALWDIKAKEAGLPLYRLLSEKEPTNRTFKAYASLFKYEDKELMESNCAAALKQGYRAFKLHENKAELIIAARELVGEEAFLATDVNCCWNLSQAISAAHSFAPAALDWLEEPLFPPEDFNGLAKLRNQINLPLAAGENACTIYEFRKMLAARAVDYVQPSVAKVGGISEFIKVAALTRENNVILAPHSAYLGPGFLATLQLAAAYSPQSLIERFFIEPEASLYGKMIDPIDGYYEVSDGIGLGAEPDSNVIKEFRLAS